MKTYDDFYLAPRFATDFSTRMTQAAINALPWALYRQEEMIQARIAQVYAWECAKNKLNRIKVFQDIKEKQNAPLAKHDEVINLRRQVYTQDRLITELNRQLDECRSFYSVLDDSLEAFKNTHLREQEARR